MLPCWACWRDERVDPARRASAGRRGLAASAACVRLVRRDPGVGLLLLVRSARAPSRFSSFLSSRLRLLESHEARVELALLGGRLLSQALVWRACLGDVWWSAASISWSSRDLLGEGLVLLADIDVVAHLGEQVGERPPDRNDLEQRRAVGVVGAADALGQQRLAVGAARALAWPPRRSTRWSCGVQRRRAGRRAPRRSAWTPSIAIVHAWRSSS